MDNNQKSDILLEQMESVRDNPGELKLKKIFRFAIPILILESLISIGLGIYLFVIPKNHCKVKVHDYDTIIYINDQKSSTFKFGEPTEKLERYLFDVNIALEIEEDGVFLATFTVTCKKYDVDIVSSASKNDNVYSMEIVGKQKTTILTDIVISSDEIIKNYTVNVVVNLKKIA